MTTDTFLSLNLADVLDASPQQVRHLYAQTLAALQAGDPAAALLSFRALGQLRPGDAALLPLHAVVALALNKPDEAAWVLGQALKLNPQNPALWFNLGQALAMAQDWARAVQAFDRLALLEPANAEVYYRRSLAWRALGQEARADADVQTALRWAPAHAGALDERARTRVLASSAPRAQPDAAS